MRPWGESKAVRIYSVTIVLLLMGCSTPYQKPEPDWQPDRVIARIDSLDSRPDWLNESSPFQIQDGNVISLGEAEIPPDHRLDAAYRIAQNNAIAQIAGAIQRRIEFIFQNAEEGTALSSRQTRFIGAEATRLISSSLRPGKRYWEKVITTSSSGQPFARYRVFATVEIPESDFKQAITDALSKRNGEIGVSSQFAEKALIQWEKMTDSPQSPH